MLPMLSLALASLVLAHPHEAPLLQRAEVRTMQPAPTLSFTPGPEIVPTEPLRAWLEEQGARDPAPTLRLPVVVERSFSPLPAIVRAWVGAGEEPPEGALLLRLDGSTLGIALLDRLAEHCGPRQTACPLWLEGRWGSPLPLLVPPVPGAPPVFTVRNVKGPIGEGDEIRAWVAE
jgi:hypothetical protein